MTPDEQVAVIELAHKMHRDRGVEILDGCEWCIKELEVTADLNVESWAPKSPLPYPQEFYPGCPCYTCDSPTWERIGGMKLPARMSLCPQCGNKRCPGAVDHERKCFGSNAPGQPGSFYENDTRHDARLPEV